MGHYVQSHFGSWIIDLYLELIGNQRLMTVSPGRNQSSRGPRGDLELLFYRWTQPLLISVVPWAAAITNNPIPIGIQPLEDRASRC